LLIYLPANAFFLFGSSQKKSMVYQESMMLNQDYKEMLSILLENKIDFIIVGAYAMAVHGYSRATAVLDIFIRPEEKNVMK